MTPTQHPLTETAAAEIYGKDEEGHTLYAWRNPERAWVVRAMRARHGNWIVRGVQGEFYACDPDIFAATYEDVTP